MTRLHPDTCDDSLHARFVLNCCCVMQQKALVERGSVLSNDLLATGLSAVQPLRLNMEWQSGLLDYVNILRPSVYNIIAFRKLFCLGCSCFVFFQPGRKQKRKPIC